MIHSEELSVEQKLKIVRKIKGFTQEEMGKAIGLSRSSISLYESDAEEDKRFTYKPTQVRKLKKFLGIESVPILKGEYPIFKGSLYKWLNLIFEGRMDEAKELQEFLSPITIVPFEPELTSLFLLFEAKVLLSERKIKEAEERLEVVKNKPGFSSNEVYYHYNCTLGSVKIYEGKFEEALKHFLYVEDLEFDNFEKGIHLYFNIGYCYSNMGRCTRAIASFERIRQLYNFELPNYHLIAMCNTLGLNYMRLGDAEEAIKLFNRTLNDAVSIGDEFYTEASLHNLGCAHVRAKNYSYALECFEEVSEKIDREHYLFLENAYYQVLCLVMLERRNAKEELEKGKVLSQSNENYTILFESLSHLATRYAQGSKQFIEEKTIPHLINERKYHVALFYCERVRECYIRESRKTKANELSNIMYEITAKMTK